MSSKKSFTVVHSGTTKSGSFFIIINQPNPDGVFVDSAILSTVKLVAVGTKLEISDEKCAKIKWS